MKVAAVIPTYNHADTVLEAAHGILDHYPVTGLVIVDDASTDGTPAVLAEEFGLGLVESSDDFDTLVGVGDYRHVFHVRLRARRGPANARNLGVSLLRPRADAFALLDSDDLYMPGKIEKSVQILQAYPEVGFVYSDYCTVDPVGRLHPQFKRPYSMDSLLKECIVNCDSVVRASVFDEARFPNIRTCEDYGFWLKASRCFWGGTWRSRWS